LRPEDKTGLMKIALYDPTTWAVLKVMESAGLVELRKTTIKFSKEFMKQVDEERKNSHVASDEQAFLLALTKMLLKKGKAEEIKRMVEILEEGG
jgi:hypothetical protein